MLCFENGMQTTRLSTVFHINFNFLYAGLNYHKRDKFDHHVIFVLTVPWTFEGWVYPTLTLLDDPNIRKSPAPSGGKFHDDQFSRWSTTSGISQFR